jgi:AcrR family transcriptional regulator
MAMGNSGRGQNGGRRGDRGRARHDPDEIAQRVADKVAQSVQKSTAKVHKAADKLHEQATKLSKAAEALDDYGPGVTEALDLWTRQGPGSRQPRFSLENLAEAAMRIADQDGIEALSMRRLASELGAGTMTLYHYVRTKDELLALVSDAVMGELILPPEQLDTDWRTAVTAIAHASKSAFERHPWTFDIVEDPAIGPNGVRHFDQSLHAVSTLPGTFADKLDVVFTVDEFVFGFCMHNRDDIAHVEDSKGSRAMVAYVADLVATGDFPHLAGLIEEHGADPLWDIVSAHSHDPDRFDRNLSRLLDGIEAAVTR